MELKDLKNTLSGLIGELKPAPITPENAGEHWSVVLDGTEETNSRWRTYMSEALKTAKTFEIHCWTEEMECIDLALQYGKQKNADWRYGKIIASANFLFIPSWFLRSQYCLNVIKSCCC